MTAVDLALDALGGRVGFVLDGRPVDLRRLVEAANAVRRREGRDVIVYPTCGMAETGERAGLAAPCAAPGRVVMAVR